jgi:hypothetical protein
MLSGPTNSMWMTMHYNPWFIATYYYHVVLLIAVVTSSRNFLCGQPLSCTSSWLPAVSAAESNLEEDKESKVQPSSQCNWHVLDDLPFHLSLQGGSYAKRPKTFLVVAIAAKAGGAMSECTDDNTHMKLEEKFAVLKIRLLYCFDPFSFFVFCQFVFIILMCCSSFKAHLHRFT